MRFKFLYFQSVTPEHEFMSYLNRSTTIIKEYANATIPEPQLLRIRMRVVILLEFRLKMSTFRNVQVVWLIFVSFTRILNENAHIVHVSGQSHTCSMFYNIHQTGCLNVQCYS